jgi:hypothetical protein
MLGLLGSLDCLGVVGAHAYWYGNCSIALLRVQQLATRLTMYMCKCDGMSLILEIVWDRCFRIGLAAIVYDGLIIKQ